MPADYTALATALAAERIAAGDVDAAIDALAVAPTPRAVARAALDLGLALDADDRVRVAAHMAGLDRPT